MGQLAGLSRQLKRSSHLGKIVTEGLAAPDVEEDPSPLPTAAPTRVPLTRSVTKPAPKSKDPEWKGYSLFLKKETHAEMNFLLRRREPKEDMSDLVQRLVERWVSEHR